MQTQRIRFITAISVLIAAMLSWHNHAIAALAFYENKLNTIIQPGTHTVVWPNLQRFNTDFNVTATELATLTTCATSGDCPQEALDLGAVYFKIFEVTDYGAVTVYYDANGVILGASAYERNTTSYNDVASAPTIPSTGEFVGVSSGAISVGSSGGAGYSIPIEIPPGTAGVAPRLAISYASQGGNGRLGVGWSLSGLSIIHRCAATLVQDGIIDGVDFDANDKFCIDGQRLIATASGADFTEYRTELDSFSKIVAYGTVSTDPDYFKVWTKSGEVMEYGVTADSRIEAQGRTEARLWALNKVTDTFNNYFSVTYQEDTLDGDYYPLQIDYTGNDAATLAPYNSVRFTYEPRPDTSLFYIAGSKKRMLNRMKGIQVYADTTLVREYKLTYRFGAGIGLSLLYAVQECAPQGCRSPVVMLWNNGNAAQFEENVNGPSTWVNSGGQAAQLDISRFKPGDYNGDGITDLYQVNGYGTSEADTV